MQRVDLGISGAARIQTYRKVGRSRKTEVMKAAGFYRVSRRWRSHPGLSVFLFPSSPDADLRLLSCVADSDGRKTKRQKVGSALVEE